MAHTPPGETRERVYRYVSERLLAGRPPTVRDVQLAMGFRAVESARAQLAALVAAGRLEQEVGRARGFRLPTLSRPNAPTVLVPLLGQVQAGDLQTAIESPAGLVPVQTRHRAGELFALAVRGRSMVGAGILPGDLVIVRRQPTAEDGEIVVALVGDEATVKRLRRRAGRVELHPANPRFRPIVVDPEELQLLGRVIEVRRVLD